MRIHRLKKALRKIALRVLPQSAVTRIRAMKHSLKKPTPRERNFPDLTNGIHGAPSRPTPRFQFKVVSILDEFSYTAWASEFDLIPVSSTGWRDQVDSSFDFLFVESAWAGNSGQWQYQLTGTNAPSDNLRSLIAHCQELGITTVFWNKEDPPHFKDFFATAALFDVIFTTDENMVPFYRRSLQHDNIHVLPFAAQPYVHNPARNQVSYAHGDVAFAGTYFQHKFPERREQMDLLLGAAAEEAAQGRFRLTIFSRHAGGDEKYQFPKQFDRWVSGSLPYSQMLAAYKSFKVFLNVNSVVDSGSMCSRRIFEIAASGTPVVSTPSKALALFFPEDEIPIARDKEQAARILRSLVSSPELRERMVHRVQRRIWENHTYEHRARTILEKLNLLDDKDPVPLVSIICSTNRDTGLTHLLDQVAEQSYKNIELHVLSHGISFDPDLAVRARERRIEVTLHTAPAEKTLGACLNQLVRAAQGDIIAKFDDDDVYCANYLRDQVNTLRCSGADLVGKASIFFRLEDLEIIARRWPHKEHQWTDFVAGATFVGWAETFRQHPFRPVTRGEDSRFLEDLRRAGKHVYSSDRFNYMAVRSSISSHTWDISDAEILSYSSVETFGSGIKHIRA